MQVGWADVLDVLVRDGVPKSCTGPDGRPRPPVPLGRRVALEGRGTTFVREVAGPPHAPTLVLLHGWMASGGLNWFRTFELLAEDFHVIAPDLRGHARGLRSSYAFGLADCADDLAAMLDELSIGPVVVAGYSMGGSVAQLLQRRHPEKVRGLVLSATAAWFPVGAPAARPIDAALGTLAAGVRLGGHLAQVPSAPLRAARSRRPSPSRDFVQWTISEFRRHDLRHLVEAARAATAFDSRPWLRDVDVPAAVVVTTRDRVVPAHRQLEAAALIGGVSVYEVDGGHAGCARERFAEPFRDACRDVTVRSSRGGRSTPRPESGARP